MWGEKKPEAPAKPPLPQQQLDRTYQPKRNTFFWGG